MLFKLLMLVHFCAAFPLKCPEPAQWTLRANGHCADPSKYFCLKNDLIKGYSENCTRSDFQQPGRKAVLRGGIDAEICSRERFQPFPIRFYTNASTYCIFLKIICNEEGQVVHNHGDRNTDTSCRCDYRRGYTFVITPKHPCFCKPSQEDCSCYLKTCSNTSSKLSQDYQCMYETAVKKVTQCQSIRDEIENRSIIPDNRRNILTENNISSLEPRQIRLVLTGCSIVLFLLFLIGSLLMYFWIYSLRALEIKDPGQEISVTEGDELNLKYTLSKEVSLLQIFKDNKEIEKKKNVEKRHFKIPKAVKTDSGEYFAQADTIKSKITKVIVESLFTTPVKDQAYGIEGEPLHLECSVYSKDVNVEWSKFINGTTRMVKLKVEGNISIKHDGKNHVLTLKYARKGDSGQYTIFANTIEKHIKVNVTEMFTSKFHPIDCIEGETLELKCSVYANDINVEWYKDKVEGSKIPVKIKENDNISIRTQDKDHSMKIKCAKMSESGQYNIKAGQVEKQITVKITEMFTSAFNPITCIEGQQLEWRCSVYSKDVSVKWYKDPVEGFQNPMEIIDNDNISIHKEGRDHIMKIQCVKMSDAGQYNIIAGNVNKQLTVCIKALEIKGPGKDINLIEGSRFQLQYSLPTNRFRLIFFKNNKPIAETENIEKNVFHICNVATTDEGSYFAEVANKRSTITQLTVQSMFTSSFDPIYCIEGEELQLKCSVYSASIGVAWFKDNANQYKQDKIERNQNISIDHNGMDRVLTIRNAKITDSGKYIIIAENVRKQLSVIVKAFFKHPLVNKTIMEGVDVSFECELENPYHKPYHVAWFKDDHEVKISSKFQIQILEGSSIHKLTIQSTTLEDEGNYCIKIQDTSSSADLDVKEIPDAVKQMSDHDKNMFLMAAKSGTAVRYYIRIMIVGENGVGKTCLLRRLMNENIDDVKSTDGINIEVKKSKINRHTQKWVFTTDEEFSKTAYQNEDFADCGFWDFAGQKEFYATHQTFLSTNAIYLLVVDISKDFGSKTHQDYIDDRLDKVGEYIDFWLKYIHCYALQDKDGLLNPPVIIIGTGIDKLKNEEDISEKKKMLYSLLDQKKEIRRHVRKTYFLSNKEPEKYHTEFEKLRTEIFKGACNIPKWGENLPTRWIVLEKELIRYIVEEKRLVIAYEEAKQLAKITSFPIFEIESELDSFLKYEHEIGNLIFFEDIKSYIVLEPKWLVDIFRCFVSPFQFQRHFVEMTEWNKLESTGILPDSLIKKLFKKVPRFDSVEHTQFALQVMEKFDIIVKPTTLSGNEKYYMPCMIKTSDFETSTQMLMVQSKNFSRTSWFCMDFNFLPPSFFNQLLVTLVKKYVLCTDQDGKMQLYRGIGIFNLEKNGCQKLVACLSGDAIAIQVWEYHTGELQIRKNNYSAIRKNIISTVHLLQRRYKMNIHYECFFKCSEGKYYKKAGKAYCDEACEKYFCPEHGSDHSLEEIRKIWFQEGEDEQTSQKHNIPVKCQYCEKIPVYRCYECRHILCDDCYLKHEKMTDTEHHTIQSTNDKMSLNIKFAVFGEINDMKVLPGGLIVIALFHTNMLLTYSVSDKQQNKIGVGGRPRSIAILDRNTVAVLLTRPYTIEIVDIRQGRVILNVCERFDRELSFLCSPMFYTDDQLYTSSLSGITVTDMSGTIDREIYLGFRPTDMCYDTKAARIYCIDRTGEKLICMDRDGNTIFTFTNTDLKNAKRITIDNEGYVLILCYNDYSILSVNVHRISPDGKSGEIIITGTHNVTYSQLSICFKEESDEVVIGVDETVYTYKKK